MQPQTLKGFRDFLPTTMRVRQEVVKRLTVVFERYGFEELQTPALEYQEVLLGKYGQEAEKLMYLFEDPGKRKVGLKYDLTVPLARAVASNLNNIVLPFKRYQIQTVWRADKPQKGRYREITQCDIDTVGSSSPLADAEILAVISDALRVLELPNFTINVNSRKILFSAMEKAGLKKDNWPTVIQSIDKLDKKDRSEIEKELISKGFSLEEIKNVFDTISRVTLDSDTYLSEIVKAAKGLGAKNIQFVPFLARGLDYYTGPIFETVVDKPSIGSITGGGRYDELLKTLGGPDLPAIGTTIGLDRVCDVIMENNLWPKLTKTATQVLVTTWPGFDQQAIEVVQKLREANINVELYLNEADLNKQLKYADKKKIPYVIIIGPEEMKKGIVQAKNMLSGEQTELPLAKLPSFFQTKVSDKTKN